MPYVATDLCTTFVAQKHGPNQRGVRCDSVAAADGCLIDTEGKDHRLSRKQRPPTTTITTRLALRDVSDFDVDLSLFFSEMLMKGDHCRQ
jgi:hypothetical protein